MSSPQHPHFEIRQNSHLKAALFKAAKNGSLDKFKTALINHNPPETIVLSRTIHRNDTLLHIAALFGHDELSDFLAKNHPNLITCKNFIGDTPLHVAARGGKHLVVRVLLPMEVPPNDSLLDVNENGNTPLHEAVLNNRYKVVEHLLKKISDYRNVVLNVNKKGKSPLYLAVESGNTQIVKRILNHSLVTSQNGADGQVETSQNILRVAITMKNIGNTGNLSNSSNPPGSSSTSQNGVNQHVESIKCVLHVEITGKDTEGKHQLVVEIGNAQDSKKILDIMGCSCASQNENVEETESVLHAAITGKDIGILRAVADYVPGTLLGENSHLLHLAASLGFLDGVKYLIHNFSKDVLRLNDDGFCPIHLASKHGHLKVIQELLLHYPDAREFLSNKRQNILHVAAENGKDNIVQYILKTEWADFLLNEEDGDGYTPLHLATKNWHPKVVSSLTWADKINLTLVNKEGLTALEVAEKYMETEMAPFKKRLTWLALMSAGTPRAQMKDADTVKRLEAAKYEPYNMDYCKDRVNTLLLVSALVATVTFAAGFTLPGGSKNSGSNEGMASMMHKILFQIYIICDSIAVYSSIIVAVMLMWAQLGDLNLLLNALRNAQRLLGLSLTMMALAFVAGVDLVVTDLKWLSIVILAMGVFSLVALLALFVPLFLPYMSNSIIARYISYYPFKLLMLASES
ncbi:accelerated cell death 6-like protein [Tanacetum coccineum]